MSEEDRVSSDIRQSQSPITRRATWCIRVTYPSGAEAFLRHGARVGGAIVQFRSRRTATVNLDFVTHGFDRGVSATVVRYRKALEDDQ